RASSRGRLRMRRPLHRVRAAPVGSWTDTARCGRVPSGVMRRPVRPAAATGCRADVTQWGRRRATRSVLGLLAMRAVRALALGVEMERVVVNAEAPLARDPLLPLLDLAVEELLD